MVTLIPANAAPILDTGNPLGFFTNVASRLLTSQLNLDLTRIQVYPTNQYTPAVHRLLQVAANVYDATTTNFYPSVFRPIFSCDQNGFGTNVFVSGYIYLSGVSGSSDTNFSMPIDVSDLAATNIQVVNLPVNLYGVPWIIGAKKGFPNFNELAMDTAFQLTRKLDITRASPSAPVNTYSNYQMFILNITNQVGVECWNSYTNAYTNQVTICAVDYLKNVALTNDEGFSINQSFAIANTITTTIWPGFNLNQSMFSFQIPLDTSVLIVSNSVYRFNQGGAPYLTGDFFEMFETNVAGCPQPHWSLAVSNDLRVIMLDTSSGVPPYPVIDYVQLNGPNGIRDLNSEILSNYDTGTGGNDFWDTNLYSFGTIMPIGVANQIEVSLGIFNPGPASGDWNQNDIIARENTIDGFRAFYYLGRLYNNSGESQIIAQAQATNSMQAPFTPIATVVQHVSWQANDPLVHYLASDLNWAGANRYDRTSWSLTNENLGAVNQRYAPWGSGVLPVGADQNPRNLAYKDPLVGKSDDWDFPMSALPGGNWLGRVHRGTPWQTIYLKATNILDLVQTGPMPAYGLTTWMDWTGDFNATDAAAMAPVADWHLASLLISMLNTNNFGSLISVNNSDPNIWLVLCDGLTALTNTSPDSSLPLGIPQFDSMVISSNSLQASAIANLIQLARAGRPNGYFNDVGDILAIPQLTEQSPFLNWNDSVQQQYGISDEAYEEISSQLLWLLRADSVGAIASTSGQMQVQFTGYDGHAYAVQVSSDLMNWVSISTNSPANGTFSFTVTAPVNTGPQFYRSVLLQ